MSGATFVNPASISIVIFVVVTVVYSCSHSIYHIENEYMNCTIVAPIAERVCYVVDKIIKFIYYACCCLLCNIFSMCFAIFNVFVVFCFFFFWFFIILFLLLIFFSFLSSSVSFSGDGGVVVVMYLWIVSKLVFNSGCCQELYRCLVF